MLLEKLDRLQKLDPKKTGNVLVHWCKELTLTLSDVDQMSLSYTQVPAI